MPDVYTGTVHGAPSAARHPSVINLFQVWATIHEKKRLFVLKEDISVYQGSLNEFIKMAEEVIMAIKGQILGTTKYGQSIAAAEELIALAKHKRSFLDGQYTAIGRESHTFATVMKFDDQRMVPKATQLGDVTAKIEELRAHSEAMPELTPSQAWALVAANTKGELNQAANLELCARRLVEFNRDWGTNYGTRDLEQTLDYMKTRTRIATQYRLERPVGEQQGNTQGGTPLYKLLMDSGFKNVWETGTSQASADLSKRGAIEEQMGYGAAVRRTGGKAQDYMDSSSTFDPRTAGGQSTAAEMPRYAATIARAQKSGVADRYGTSYILWKDSLRQRVTWTPGDSWNMGGEGPQSVKSFVGVHHPEGIFAHADQGLLRVLMAEATGKDTEFLKRIQTTGHGAMATGGAYIETQIHGDLSWGDVDEVVLDPSLPNLNAIRSDFDEFKRKKGFNFSVRTITGA